jgi:hypothetical protein
METGKGEQDKAAFLEEMSQLYDRMHAPERQPELVTFEQREQRAWEIGRTAQKRLLEGHLARDPAAVGAESAACPQCGEISSQGKRKRSRKVKARSVEVGWEREEFYCRRCRRHFSPSRSSVEDRERGLQSEGAAADSDARGAQ